MSSNAQDHGTYHGTQRPVGDPAAVHGMAIIGEKTVLRGDGGLVKWQRSGRHGCGTMVGHASGV
jgi:hypothetical protein